MNTQSAWRLAAARRIAPLYTGSPQVIAVLVAGSVARGCADRHSDVEIGVVWERWPDERALHAAMARAGGTDWELDPLGDADDVWYEEYAVGGLKIDLRHMTAPGMDAVLEAVVDRADTDERRQAIVSALLHGVVLHGAGPVADWRARAVPYPDALAAAMVRRGLTLDSWWPVPMLSERGDLPLVYAALSQAAQSLLTALLGLNRLDHPGAKWVNRTIAEMALTPPDLSARLTRVFRAEPLEGADLMRDLIEETYALAAERLPALDLRAERAEFRYARPVWDAPEGA